MAPNHGKCTLESSKLRTAPKILARLIFALGVIIASAQSFATESRSADQIVDSLQKNYDATVDFVADFRQETEVKTLNRKLKASGKLYFKRPGKMFWRYEEPKGQFVLADGKNLYFYQPEQNQVIKSPLKNAFRSDIPLSFLLGLGNLKKDFNATLKGIEENQYVLAAAWRAAVRRTAPWKDSSIVRDACEVPPGFHGKNSFAPARMA